MPLHGTLTYLESLPGLVHACGWLFLAYGVGRQGAERTLPLPEIFRQPTHSLKPRRIDSPDYFAVFDEPPDRVLGAHWGRRIATGIVCLAKRNRFSNGVVESADELEG